MKTDQTPNRVDLAPAKSDSKSVVFRKYWTPLPFGVHKGLSLPQVVFKDPDWFLWMHEKGYSSDPLQDQSDDVYFRATRIAIPQPDTDRRVAEYGIFPHKHAICCVDVVLFATPEHQGSTATFRRPVFDLSVARRLRSYDK